MARRDEKYVKDDQAELKIHKVPHHRIHLGFWNGGIITVECREIGTYYCESLTVQNYKKSDKFPLQLHQGNKLVGMSSRLHAGIILGWESSTWEEYA